MPHSERAPAGWRGEEELRARAVERLIGVRSSKVGFYAAWRQKSARLDRTIETLERISTALCATAAGPGAVCRAVVEAAAHHLSAPWAALIFADGASHGLPSVILHRRSGAPPRDRELAELARRACLERAPIALACTGGRALIAPMPLRGELVGALAVALGQSAARPDGGPPAGGGAVDARASLEGSDVSIIVTLANHAGLALHNAWLFQESERQRLRSEAVSRVAARRAAELERRNVELERTRRRLEHAGRRQLLSRERNRIARDLHDSVAQHLLTIGLNLEWCRRQAGLMDAVREQIEATQALARDAVVQIRSVIFELARDGPGELRPALQEVIEDVEAGTGLTVSLRTMGRQQPLNAATTHALVQISREALFNVLRHANASRAWLTLCWAPGRVVLSVADDGHGDPRALRLYLERGCVCGEHLGLAGIGERVRAHGGSAAITRRRGGGVRLRVTIPLAVDQASRPLPGDCAQLV